MLWACLHFPDLPLETFARAGCAATALAIVTSDTHPRIIALNAAARLQGVCAGMSVSAALALMPALRMQPRNLPQEAQTLREIAQWAVQFSPTLNLAGADALLLEIGAGLKLFAGLERLLARIRSGLSELGVSATVAAAPTPTAALMLARAAQGRAITTAEQLGSALAPLPVATVVDSESIRETLTDLGIHSVGELLQLPRDGLARRFGQALLDTLERALGRLPDPRTPFTIPEHFSSRLELPAPAWEVQALLFGAKRLVTLLGGWLLGRGLGVMQLNLQLIHEEHPASTLRLNLSTPSRDAAHLCALLRERLERMRLPDRVESIVLSATETARLSAHNHSLFPNLETAADTELCERLVARLGDDAVCALRAHADHRPELAWRSEPYPAKNARPNRFSKRPLWLLSEPQPLAAFLRDTHAQLTLLDGPERIESGWWEGQDVRRDYFVARARSGQTLWVFKHPDAARDWHVHGVFA